MSLRIPHSSLKGPCTCSLIVGLGGITWSLAFSQQDQWRAVGILDTLYILYGCSGVRGFGFKADLLP